MKHFPWRECGWAVLFLLVLAGLYFGAYFAMMRPIVSVSHSERGVSGRVPFYNRPWMPHTMAEWASTIFAPMHAIDRALRPDFWAESR